MSEAHCATCSCMSLNQPRRPYNVNVELLNTVDQIDLYLNPLSDLTRRLRERRNALVPISRLPSDVLIDIFMECRHASSLEFDSKANLRFAFSQVCSRWRALALETSALWSLISSNQPHAQILGHLERSNSVGLDAYISCAGARRDTLTAVVDSEAVEFWQRFIQQHSGRFRTLAIQCPRRELSQITAGMGQVMPMLEDLMLSSGTAVTSPDAVPPQLCTMSAPNLRRLSLTDYTLPWPSVLLRDASILQHLEIQLGGGLDRSRATTMLPISEDTVANTLVALPLLKTLRLSYLPIRIRENTPPKWDVALPLLEHLSLRGDILGCLPLLRRIALPFGCGLHVEVVGDCLHRPAFLIGLAAALLPRFEQERYGLCRIICDVRRMTVQAAAQVDDDSAPVNLTFETSEDSLPSLAVFLQPLLHMLSPIHLDMANLTQGSQIATGLLERIGVLSTGEPLFPGVIRLTLSSCSFTSKPIIHILKQAAFISSTTTSISKLLLEGCSGVTEGECAEMRDMGIEVMMKK